MRAGRIGFLDSELIIRHRLLDAPSRQAAGAALQPESVPVIGSLPQVVIPISVDVARVFGRGVTGRFTSGHSPHRSQQQCDREKTLHDGLPVEAPGVRFQYAHDPPWGAAASVTGSRRRCQNCFGGGDTGQGNRILSPQAEWISLSWMILEELDDLGP